MLAGTKKLLGKEYKHFCDSMLTAHDNNALPVGFQVDDVMGVSCQDICDLCNDFENDTDLKLTAHLFACHECGKAHVFFEVDNQDDEKEYTKYLQ